MKLSLRDARKNEEIVSLADSQVLRWLDELNGVVDAEEKARALKHKIRKIRKEESAGGSKRELRQLYRELDELQLKPDYLLLVIDREKDYRRACGGFSLNGIRYARLLGTSGGIKNSTIVFISERHVDEIRRRIENGRDPHKELVPAKLEAYKALACSASTPVSWPEGVIVVNDFETVFHDSTVYLSDENDGEPTMELQQDTEIHLDGCDGCGIILPSLAEKWSADLDLNYVIGGCNTRIAYEKGMVFTFDFVDFAENVAHSYLVKDAWGVERDVRFAELILTTSMLKLWDSYNSCEEYLRNCHENKYTFCVTKVTPKSLENERSLNYQFVQSFALNDHDIDELIAPTMEMIHDVLGGDWRKAILFLQGKELTADNVGRVSNGIVRAIMADRRVLNDSYVRSYIYGMIKNKIDEAKTGVLQVHGNYSIVTGDPYALCQSVFGLPITGLLRSGEIYNEYWSGTDSDELLCFRAPMSVHNNIRRVRPCKSEAASYWYRYIHSGTVFNCWDTATAALNGCDFDGDLVMLTDNPVLLRNHKELPALMCVQRKASKKVVADEDLVRSNIESFGNDIGRTTNWITSMYEVQSHFPAESEEYNVLEYRIRCGQLYQQNVIDKTKGIIAKPMPREWYDRHAIYRMEDDEARRLYAKIVADRKPYFMRYIYPDLMREYREYRKNTDRNALREFGVTVDELRKIPYAQLSPRQIEFLHFYDKMMPVGVGDCVMNRICRRFEEAFDHAEMRNAKFAKFDPSVLKAGVQYPVSQRDSIRKLAKEYSLQQKTYKIFSYYENIDEDDATRSMTAIRDWFMTECHRICPNELQLCDILVDLCYQYGASKRFLWDLFSDIVVRNLLEKHGWSVSFPTRSADGDVVYGGERFNVISAQIGGELEQYSFE